MLLGNFKRGKDRKPRKRRGLVFTDKPLFKNQAHVPYRKGDYLTRKGAVIGAGLTGAVGAGLGLIGGAALGKNAEKSMLVGAGLGVGGSLLKHTTAQHSPFYLGVRNKRTKVMKPRKQKELYY